MLIYETHLANIDPAKATRATLGSTIFYLFLENHKRFRYFYLRWNKVPYLSSYCLHRFAAKMYSLNIFSLKMITTSKFIGRIFVKLKTSFIITAERPFLTSISFNSKILYISFVNCKGVIPLWKFFEIRFIVILKYSQSSFLCPVNFIIQSSTMAHPD